MMTRRAALVAAVALLLAAPSLSAPDPRVFVAANPAAGKILDVPFIAQGDYDCGPVALAMALRYQGLTADPAAINDRFKSDAVAGVFTVDLLIAAGDAGADAHWVGGDWQKLRAEIDAGRPPVVFLNRQINPLPARHFATAVGWLQYQGRDYVVLHSGAEAFQILSRRVFQRQWSRTKNMMLTLKPKKIENRTGE